MASYRPYPPQSSFGPSAGQSSLPPHPPPHRPPSHGNQYPQNWGSAPSFPQGYSQMPTSSHFQHSGYGNAYPAPSHHQPPAAAQPQQQPQQYPYTPPPPLPPDTSYPPPPPPPPPSVGQNVMNVQQQSQHGPMYFPSQYSQPPHLPPPPPPPSSPPSSSIPPPPPPPPSPPPIPSSVPSQNQAKESGAGPDRIRHERDGRASTEGSQHIASKQQKPPVHPIPAKKANGSSGRLETEEERRLRKKREMDKQRQEERHRQQLKESQNSVLQKTQNMASSSKAHGSVSGSRMGDRRATTLLSGERTENRLKRPSTFLCRMKFRNELPDPTAQPKLMTLKRDKDRFTRYNITSLEKMHKPKLYFEPDLGIPLDLLDLSVYNPPKEKLALAPEDQELLRDDEPLTPLKKDGIRRKERPSDHGVSWLVKTQYISPLSSEGTRQSLTEKQAKELRETREGHNILENLNNRDRQIQEILTSFEACKSRPVHATNKSLQPVEIMPLLPYFDRYDDQFVVVNFDGEPTADSEMFRKTEKSTRGACESKAIMKSFVAPGSDPEKPDRFLGYMVPSQDEVSKDMCGEDEDISFSWVREYNWDVKGEDLDDLSTYLVTFDENSASYLPLPTKLILRKRRAKEGRSYEEAEQFAPPAKVTVRRGDTTAVIERKDLGASSFSKGSGSGMKRDSMYAEDDFVRLNTEDEELGQFSGADDYISE